MLTNEDTIKGAYDNVRPKGKLKVAMSFNGPHALMERENRDSEVRGVGEFNHWRITRSDAGLGMGGPLVVPRGIGQESTHDPVLHGLP